MTNTEVLLFFFVVGCIVPLDLQVDFDEALLALKDESNLIFAPSCWGLIHSNLHKISQNEKSSMMHGKKLTSLRYSVPSALAIAR